MNTITMKNEQPVIPSLVIWVLGAWFTLAMGLVISGAFRPEQGMPPLGLVSMVLGPVLMYALAWGRSERFRQWVLSIDMRLLMATHSLRMIGMGFVFLWFYGQLPAVFALPAGLGDAMAAVGGLYLAILLYSGVSVSRAAVWRWNTFGLLDFVIAVGAGALAAPGALLDFGTGATSLPMTVFPMAIIPAFFVPLFTLTHLAIYAQLKASGPGTGNLTK
jgi:drug/metabolite transporter superfamily protein YnfA